ncbi:MAG: metallophosphoesterase [Rhizobiales bacterium]|nr:metallophosphoesterase [Hyphomicrobiales bacterium]
MSFLLAHLSDPHIGPLPRMPVRALVGKRLTGVINWHRSRATIHSMAVLDAIIDDIAIHKPDHVALTGDLVNVGYPPEFPVAAARLSPLGTPDHVSIIPGNHDAYVRGSLDAMARVFGPFMCGDDGETGYPYLRVRQNIALIGMNTGVPTAPFFATGTMGRPQGERLARLLQDTRKSGLFRVVMIHHPPLRRGVKFGRGLTDAKSFERILREEGAELVLHGHNHRFSIHHAAGPSGPVPVLGVGSASAVPGTPQHLAEYSLIRLTPGGSQPIRIERRGIGLHDRKVSEIGISVP